jgi:hypothetical protein
MKSIRFLTAAQHALKASPLVLETIANDFRATCVGFQHQLHAQTTTSLLEGSLVSAIFLYVDLVLLHTPLHKIAISQMHLRLADALMKPNRIRDRAENRDIALLLAETTTAAQGNLSSLDQKRKDVLVEKFNKVLTRLEELEIG